MGVSGIELNARDPQDLLDQADKSLYVSKRTGRNRSTRWDQIPPGVELAEKQAIEAPREDGKLPIPFHAVTALMSALAHRDASTADHCQRVADLCVATGKGLMSVQETFVLEVAAMLHDIGKLGVPDAILLKPGPLTEEEWTIMRTHDQMGVEIISAAFGSKELTEIVRTHHAWFSGNPENVGLPTGQDIPLGARILSIADAYDAMVSERPYHRPKTRERAFEELRKFSGKQFDPSLVERLIEQVVQRDAERGGPNVKMPQQMALRIRLEIERLACAVEERDMAMLTAMAGHIAAVAAKDGLPEIAGVASTLERSASIEKDLEGVLKLTNELLALCRSPQSITGAPALPRASVKTQPAA
jgi:HD-GYP domain-containing protein (c-di-GMP phosphodiesterase class II)